MPDLDGPANALVACLTCKTNRFICEASYIWNALNQNAIFASRHARVRSQVFQSRSLCRVSMEV